MSLIKRKEAREIKFLKNINPYADGSVIAEFGNTKVHITAFLEDKVPPFLRDQGRGWITAEYSMLPSSTHTRSKRERTKVGGRTMEIQRLIGRCLRSIVDLEKLGERTIFIDCDVLVADGGTRTTSISGAYIVLKMVVDTLLEKGILSESPIKEPLAAISIGIDESDNIIADLNYEEDSTCKTDMNIVMTESGRFIEIQGTAEKDPFTKEQFDAILECAVEALKGVFEKQKEVLQ